MSAYYNEIDPFAAQWLRNLISAGHIAPGEVDTRSIEDVPPSDLTGFTQCHFFAGIGGWSRALRASNWDDSRPVWTGSCPCQPFSQAGKGAGLSDDRHLWPACLHHIRELRPTVVFGEQVESAISHGWLDLVQDGLEGIDYAFAPVSIPACGVGAPHRRNRLWWVANANEHGRIAPSERRLHDEKYHAESRGGVGNALPTGLSLRESETVHRAGRGQEGRATKQPGSSSSFWSDAEWIECRDGKKRPVEPRTFPLAHGIPGRVGQLRAYGNAIVPQCAKEVIQTFMGFVT